jgi:phospholipase/lecithinase/hemolysin
MLHHSLLAQASRGLIAGAIPLTFVAVTPAIAQAFSFSDLYVFGDSLSDAGATYQRTGGLIPPSPPYAGRLSNGPVWVEYLASDLGIPFNPAKDFAVFSATTGTANTNPLGNAFGLGGLQQQITGYIATNQVADPNALYVVYAGADDYLGGGITNPAIPVQNLTNSILALTSIGAKNFLVPNLPNLGNLPSTLGNPESVPLNLLTAAHNQVLDQALIALSQQLDPSVNLISLDVNGLFKDAIANPAKYNLTNVTDACLLQTSPTTFSVCNSPETYLFWDIFHPTTVAHQQIANLAYNSVSAAVPEPPATLGLLAFGIFLGVASVFKRQQARKFQPGVVVPLEVESNFKM